VKVRSLILNSQEVLAVLNGSKTQHCIPLRVQPIDILPMKVYNQWDTLQTLDPNHGDVIGCRWGVPGDRLWVKETFMVLDSNTLYRADFGTGKHVSPWTSAGKMPRSASRILLEITSVTAERLTNLSQLDALAEGMTIQDHEQGTVVLRGGGAPVLKTSFVDKYIGYWEKKYGKKYPWHFDVFVWKLEFKRCQ